MVIRGSHMRLGQALTDVCTAELPGETICFLCGLWGTSAASDQRGVSRSLL